MSHMNESCHIWTSHVTYEWVMSHMNESCHIWISHITHPNASCHKFKRVTITQRQRWRASPSYSIHIWSHSYLNFKSFIFEFQVIHIFGEPRLQIYEWVVSHTQISHITQLQGRAVEPHLLIWMGHVTYEDASCHTQHMHRVAKFHGIFTGYFLQEHCNWWLFCGIRPATYKASYGSSAPCTTQMSEIAKLKCSVYEPHHCVWESESVDVAALRHETCLYVYGCEWVWGNESSSLTMGML